MLRTQLFLSLSWRVGKSYQFSILTSHLWAELYRQGFEKLELSPVFWLQVEQLIERSFKRCSGNSAFLQPIGIFLSKIAKTVTFVYFQNCHFVLTTPRVQGVILCSVNCFKVFQVVPCNQQFVFLQHWIFSLRINKSTAWILDIFHYKTENYIDLSCVFQVSK